MVILFCVTEVVVFAAVVTAIGLLIFGVLNNGLNLLQLDIFVRLWMRGIVLLAALLINVYALHLQKKRLQLSN